MAVISKQQGRGGGLNNKNILTSFVQLLVVGIMLYGLVSNILFFACNQYDDNDNSSSPTVTTTASTTITTNNSKQQQQQQYQQLFRNTKELVESVTTTTTTTTTVDNNYLDFYEIAKKTGTDKVAGVDGLTDCLKTGNCLYKNAEREECRTWGHFYHTMYNHWLKEYTKDDAQPFQFLEIGHFEGKGFDAYTKFLPNGELHSMEISCTSTWPKQWGNFAAKNPRYSNLVDTKRLHCIDANEYDQLNKIWKTEMKRPNNSPPLKIVVDDGSHKAEHMAMSMFFWLPRIEPGGLLIIEDIQPIDYPNKFRTHILPQVMKDLHWCGDETQLKDTLCFPTIQPLLAGVHCEMHICVFIRNNVPASEPDKEHSITPHDAFTNAQNCLFGPH